MAAVRVSKIEHTGCDIEVATVQGKASSTDPFGDEREGLEVSDRLTDPGKFKAYLLRFLRHRGVNVLAGFIQDRHPVADKTSLFGTGEARGNATTSSVAEDQNVRNA